MINIFERRLRNLVTILEIVKVQRTNLDILEIYVVIAVSHINCNVTLFWGY